MTLPGCGSLLAGRVVGYAQIPIALIGFGMTTIFGIQFIVWYFSNSAHLRELQLEPDLYFQEIWTHLRWALAGMALFFVSWVWALATSLAVLAGANTDNTPSRPKPPKLNP
jgi:hypothetical protein